MFATARHPPGSALRTDERMTRRHLTAAVTALLATAGSPAGAEQWATCKYTHDDQRRCVEIQFTTETSVVREWCAKGISDGAATFELGRTCPSGPSCTRHTESVRARSQEQCETITLAEATAQIKHCAQTDRTPIDDTCKACSWFTASQGLILATTYVDYGGTNLQSFCKSQGGQFRRN